MGSVNLIDVLLRAINKRPFHGIRASIQAIIMIFKNHERVIYFPLANTELVNFTGLEIDTPFTVFVLRENLRRTKTT